jgi:ERCC4-type nuclease
VDYRAGSKELITPLQKLGISVEETTLEFGDLMWEGRGEKGEPVLVGIEFKKLEELVQAIRTERLQGHQLVGMRETYRYSYLFIEGRLMFDSRTGLLQKAYKSRFARMPMPGSMTASELMKRVHVLHLAGGLTPWWSEDRTNTLHAIAALYRTWTDKDLDKHKSHIAAYEAPSIRPVNGLRRTLKTFPDVGMKASLAAQLKFGSLREAVNAPVEAWASLEVLDDKGKPRRLGTSVAEKITEFCNRRWK